MQYDSKMLQLLNAVIYMHFHSIIGIHLQYQRLHKIQHFRNVAFSFQGYLDGFSIFLVCEIYFIFQK